MNREEAKKLVDKADNDNLSVNLYSEKPEIACNECEESIYLDQPDAEIRQFVKTHATCGLDVNESKDTRMAPLTHKLLEAIRAKNWHEANVLFERSMQERIVARIDDIKTRVMMEDEKRCELCGSTKNVTMVDGTPLCAKCDPESDLDEAFGTTSDQEGYPGDDKLDKQKAFQAAGEKAGFKATDKQKSWKLAHGVQDDDEKDLKEDDKDGWVDETPEEKAKRIAASRAERDKHPEYKYDYSGKLKEDDGMEKGDGTDNGGPMSVTEETPPGQESWVKANKQRFIDEYGEEKGLEVLYATANRNAKK